MKKTEPNFIALIFEQGGTLRNICTSDSKEQVENFMSISYDFPFYAQYLPFKNLKNVSDMITVDNLQEVIKTDLTDTEIDFKVVGDFKAEDIIHQVRIEDETVTNAFGKEIKFDLNLFSAWTEMNECQECENGVCEVGPICSQPASMCCGGCYEKRECQSCEGSGLINSNI
jgi:hypothetical protein